MQATVRKSETFRVSYFMLARNRIIAALWLLAAAILSLLGMHGAVKTTADEEEPYQPAKFTYLSWGKDRLESGGYRLHHPDPDTEEYARNGTIAFLIAAAILCLVAMVLSTVQKTARGVIFVLPFIIMTQSIALTSALTVCCMIFNASAFKMEWSLICLITSLAMTCVMYIGLVLEKYIQRTITRETTTIEDFPSEVVMDGQRGPVHTMAGEL